MSYAISRLDEFLQEGERLLRGHDEEGNWIRYNGWQRRVVAFLEENSKEDAQQFQALLESTPRPVEHPYGQWAFDFLNRHLEVLKRIRGRLSEEKMSEAVSEKKRVIVALHGIRTLAAWTRTLQEVAQENNWDCPMEKWNFGRFSIIRFLISWQREAKVRWFRVNYEELMDNRRFQLNDDNCPSVVAHSFGTYIIGYSLLKYEHIRVDKVVLCGSILPRNFPWDKIIERGQICAIRNEYGVKDKWVERVRWFVPGTGASGSLGFKTNHNRLEQYKFLFDHSEYFSRGHMREFWRPFISKILRPLPRKYEAVDLPTTQRPLGLYVIGAGIILILGTALIKSGLTDLIWDPYHVVLTSPSKDGYPIDHCSGPVTAEDNNCRPDEGELKAATQFCKDRGYGNAVASRKIPWNGSAWHWETDKWGRYWSGEIFERIKCEKYPPAKP